MKTKSGFGAIFCSLALSAFAHAETTLTSGQEYADLCQARGVPLPPPWGSPSWIYNGSLAPYELLAGAGIGPAHVHYYVSTSPSGLCMALPRGDMGQPVSTFGVICQGDTGYACFWDDANQQIPWATATSQIPIVSGAADAKWWGGARLETEDGGMCADCHRGENAFVVLPGSPLDLSPLGIAQNRGGWYRPIVSVNWLENAGPASSPAANDPGINPMEACTSCHSAGAQAGRFPVVGRIRADTTSRYCEQIISPLRTSARMPPFGATTTASHNIQWDILESQCDFPPSGNPLWPHLLDIPFSYHYTLPPWLLTALLM